MPRITATAAASELPYSLEQIEETVRDFDIDRNEVAETNGSPATVTFDRAALEKVIAARGLNQRQNPLAAGLARVEEAVGKLTTGLGASFLTGITAVAAAAAAIVAFLSMEASEDAMSARSNYEVLSTISGRIVDSRIASANAAKTEDPVERARLSAMAEIYAEDLDTQVQLLDLLNSAGIIVGSDWTTTVSALCKPMDAANYHDRAEDLFKSFKAMCERALAAGDWAR